MAMKLYVGNLAVQTTNEDLQALFEQAGTVESVNVIEDRETGRSRGVLERLGMRFVRDAHFYGFDCVHYLIAREDWRDDGSFYHVKNGK